MERARQAASTNNARRGFVPKSKSRTRLKSIRVPRNEIQCGDMTLSAFAPARPKTLKDEKRDQQTRQGEERMHGLRRKRFYAIQQRLSSWLIQETRIRQHEPAAINEMAGSGFRESRWRKADRIHESSQILWPYYESIEGDGV